MPETYPIVRLLKSHSYPTYQLYACMANNKTAPRDGLRLAGLIVMEWLRKRLGESAPESLRKLPPSSDYLKYGNEVLPFLHLRHGFIIDVVSLPERGVWSLQIIEPDLDLCGPERKAVPGRTIETNISFIINGQTLECGFQTMISDPEGTEPLLRAYRPEVVRQLALHSDFGLRQVTWLTDSVEKIATVGQLRELERLQRDDANQLPSVVFTCLKDEQQSLPAFQPSVSPSSGLKLPPLPVLSAPTAQPPYDAASFARSNIAVCRTYILSDKLFKRAASDFGCPEAAAGAIFILEPKRFGGSVRQMPYRANSTRQEETISTLRQEMSIYSSNKNVSFGKIIFLPAARKGLADYTQTMQAEAEAVARDWAQKAAELVERQKAELEERDRAYASLMEQLERQKQYGARMRREREVLLQKHADELARYRCRLEEKEEELAYLRRKLSKPKEHQQIAAWAEENYAGHLILHPKAVALLADKSAKPISVDLICDALDFLATDYWAMRYRRISKAEMNCRCAVKYGRPFEIKPTGATTIEYTPAQYKIKYFLSASGKLIESPLDFHLAVGNDPQSLLRIYFLHDDKKQLIVVGSLPRHLRAVTVS